MPPLPADLQRLAAELDGWLDLRCPDRVLEHLQPLLDRPAARSAGLALRVRAFVATSHFTEALADLQELRTTDHEPEWLDLTEAWCRKRIQDLPGAVRCMEQLLARNTRSAIGHFNLGCYLALSGEHERALDEVTVACGLDATFRDLLLDEPDLDSLQREPRFEQLLAPAADLAAAGDEEALADDPLADDAEETEGTTGDEGDEEKD